MKYPRIHSHSLATAILIVFSLTMTLVGPMRGTGQKLKAEEIIAKHLEAVGAAETRESITTRVISGTSVAAFRSPGTGVVGGLAVLASEGEKNVLAMTFDITEYPREQIGFDGNAVTASYVRPGVRTTFGDFFMTHDMILKHGLLGGVLSAAWPLYGSAQKNARLEMAGTTRIDNRETYRIRYSPRRGSELRVTIYLDRETFHHVRTDYERVIPAGMGSTPDASARQRETRYKMTEDFSDFKRVSGLMLPHNYKISLRLETGGGSYIADWTLYLTDFAFNQRLDPHSFNVQAGS